jgi:hypothetical protein
VPDSRRGPWRLGCALSQQRLGGKTYDRRG